MNKELKGLRCVVSGFGKIAMDALEKLIAYGAVPIIVSDSKGYLLDENGFDYMKITFLRDIKAQQRKTTKRFMLGLSTMREQNLGVKGSNMPSTPMVANILTKANVLIAPAMAADARRVCSLLLQGIKSLV
ncbi:hypothetical protein Patl1_33402 [Pistacia atlantica]|uniref:Uncharacterized protein n=1 Tax=Pistacia atlantica TaxID=434234 RepID=A0ACC0ZPJ0_9ROSI|nr:hypothetical protein Patl1_33402 [Pistacia atlantica]